MTSWLVCSSPDQAVWVRALAGDIVFCSKTIHLTLTVPFSTQVYKWVPANLMLGVTLGWTSIPSKLLHATEIGDRHPPDGPLGLYADFSFLPTLKLNWHFKCALQTKKVLLP